MLISTPSDREGYIWQYTVKTAQVVFVYCIPCPECGEYHRASDHYIDFAEERDPEKIERDDIAHYVFPCCGFVGTDRARKRALNDGIWCALEDVARDEDGQISLEHKKEDWQMPGRELFTYLKAEKPAKIAFHSPAIVSKLVPISEIAAAFLRGLSDPAKMHYFDNQIRAVAHVPYRQNRKEDIIRALKDDRPAGLVPGNNRVAALIAGVDTQKDSFKVVIRAFGWGLMQPSWKIMEGEVETLADCIENAVRDRVSLNGTVLYGANLIGRYLRGGKFAGAEIKNCGFRECDLRDCNFRGATLTSCNLRGSWLWGADFTGAALNWTVLHRAHLTGAVFERCQILSGSYEW